MVSDMSQHPHMWFYIGQDRRVYGPASSEDMLAWLKTGFFGENLLLRTASDGDFHTLQEWMRICKNVPFSFPVVSWNHQYAEHMNLINSAGSYSSNTNTPASTPLPRNLLAMPSDLPSENLQHLYPPQALLFQNGQRLLPSNQCVTAPLAPVVIGPPPQNPNATIFSPGGAQPPPHVFYPVVSNGHQIQSIFGGQQQVHHFDSHHPPPGGLGMSMASNGNTLQMQMSMQNGHYDQSSIPSELRSTTASVSPDSEQYRISVLKQVADKMVDTSDNQWKRDVKEVCLSPIHWENPSVGTQSEPIQISKNGIERLISELLGVRINIVDGNGASGKSTSTGSTSVTSEKSNNSPKKVNKHYHRNNINHGHQKPNNNGPVTHQH